MAPITKDRISSPLEAGTSLLELKQLPLQLTSALDYVSTRLARKGLHLSMIVVRKDLNILPASSSPVLAQSPQQESCTSTATSPARSLFSTASSTITKSLRKHSSNSSLSDEITSATRSPSAFSFSKWPGLPSSPKLALSPKLASSISPPSSPRPMSPTMSPTMNEYGLSLMQTTTLTLKAEKVLRRTIQKAEKKLSIGSGWLSNQALSIPSTCPATNDLIRRSLKQNSIVFSSEGLTLLSLDDIYDFKCILHTYSSTLSSSDLTATVDSLHRLILSQNNRKITKGYLLRVYDWLSISTSALLNVNNAYKLAYGGPTREGGIDMQGSDHREITPMLLQTMHEVLERQQTPPIQKPLAIAPKPVNTLQQSLYTSRVPKAAAAQPTLNLLTTFHPVATPKLQTLLPPPINTSTSSSFAEGIASPTISTFTGVSLVEVGESFKGRDYQAWSLREDRGPHMRGPVTPNGYGDFTPMTKGEWSFLKDGFGGRRAGVEKCC